ncbi:MAG: DUF190 domain-containing protein [Solirubrobacteraceae bacterium]
MTDQDCLKLTVYFGERDRAEGRLLADALIDIFEHHHVAVSCLLRGIEGFGIKHQLHTAALLTLSHDLPLVAFAVDTRERIERLLPDVQAACHDGLITLERTWMLAGGLEDMSPVEHRREASKLTVCMGRQDRAGGRPAYEAVVGLLRRYGFAGAIVLLGVDGTAHGVRQRAKFFARNASVPLMIVSIGDSEGISRILPELAKLLPRALITLERVRVCKRDGLNLDEPHRLSETDQSGLGIWQNLTIHTGEHARHGSAPLRAELLARLRKAGAVGATSLRGFWGYHGAHEPHGERFWAVRRHVPVLTIVIDTPANIHRWYPIVDELTGETGLVTSEIVPAMRGGGPNIRRGGLRLADPVD